MLRSFFLVLREFARSARLHLVTENQCVVGRGIDCSLRLPDSAVSRIHALFSRNGSTVMLRDLGSHNGTFLSGSRIVPDTDVELVDGSHVQINPYHLHVYLDPAHVERDLVPSDDSTESLSLALAGTDDVERCEQKLTPAERLVLEAYLKGMGRKAAARLLKIKPETVHTHAKAIYRIFGVESQHELMAKYVARR